MTTEPSERTVDAAKFVEVVIYYRRPGPAGEAAPGYRKLELLQPAEFEGLWRQVRQHRTKGLPNLAITFDGRPIIPTVIGEEKDDGAIFDDAELAALTARRDGLRSDVSRLEGQAAALSKQMMAFREAAAVEEARHQAALAAAQDDLQRVRAQVAAEQEEVHKRWLAIMEADRRLSESAADRVIESDRQIREAVRHREEIVTTIGDLVASAKANQKGSVLERVIDQAGEKAEHFASHPIGGRVIVGFFRKFGLFAEETE